MNDWMSEWMNLCFHLAKLWVYGKSQKKFLGYDSAYSAYGWVDLVCKV